MPILYQATNIKNNKKYVGITKKTLSARISQHMCAARRGATTVFARAIRKHGRESFLFEVLKETPSYEEVLKLERDAIGTIKPSYNTAAGGVGPSGVKWSADRRAKLIPALVASWTSERKIKASLSAKARITPGMISELRRRSPPITSKSVVCVNDGMRFASIKLAQAHYGLSTIGANLSGRQLTCGDGLFFAFAKDCINESQRLTLLSRFREEAASKKHSLSAKSRARAVQCINTGEIFESTGFAGKKYNVSAPRIAQICNGFGMLRGGLRFKWLDQDKAPEIKAASADQIAAAKIKIREALDRGVEKNRKKIICVDTGETYPSVSSAARTFGVSVSTLSASIYRNGRTSGFSFQFMDCQL